MSASRRVAVLCTSRDLFTENCISALTALRWDVQVLRLAPVTLGEFVLAGERTFDQWVMSWEQDPPEFCLGVNLNGVPAPVADWCAWRGRAFVNWLVDHPALFPQAWKCQEPWLVLACLDQSHVDWLEARRLGPQWLMPMGVPPEFLGERKTVALKAPVFAGYFRSADTEEYLRRAIEAGRERTPLQGTAVETSLIASLDEGAAALAQARDWQEVAPRLHAELSRHGLADHGAAWGYAFFKASQLRRCAVLQAAVAEGLHVFGDSDWQPHLGGAWRGLVPYQKLANLFHEAVVSLNIHNPQNSCEPNSRAWEVTGAGGCLLTDRVLHLEQYYEPGVEVWTWDSLAEARDKLRFLSVHVDVRDRVAAAGMARARQCHTMVHRLEALVRQLQERGFLESAQRPVARLRAGLLSAALRTGQCDQVMRLAKEWLGLEPTSAEPLFYMGTVAVMQGQWREAITLLRHVEKRRPLCAAAAGNLVVALARSEQWDQAQQVLAGVSLAAASPALRATLHTHAGNLMEQRGDPAQGQKCWREALECDAGAGAAQANLKGGQALKWAVAMVFE